MAYNEQQMHKNGANSAMAGMVGAAIGAAVGSAATAILSDQKKRTKVVSAIKGMHKKALIAAESFKTQTNELQEKAEKTAVRATKTLEDGAGKSKRSRRLSV